MAKRLDVRRFRKWLGGFQPRGIVGTKRDGLLCPLATCFNVNVGATTFCEMQHDERGRVVGTTKLPKWASRFVENVDNWALTEKKHTVTADECLKILDKISII